MPAPSTAITRLDLSFGYGEFNLIGNLKKFIGLRVLPPLAVALEASDFLKIVLASYLTKVEDTRRAPKSTYARDDWEWTKDSYVVDEKHRLNQTFSVPRKSSRFAAFSCAGGQL